MQTSGTPPDTGPEAAGAATSARRDRLPFWAVLRGVLLGYALSWITLLVLALLLELIGLPLMIAGRSLHLWLWGFGSPDAAAASLLFAALLCVPCAWLVQVSVQGRVERDIRFVYVWACVAGIGLPLWMLDVSGSWVLSTAATVLALWALGSLPQARRPLRPTPVTRLLAAAGLLAILPVLAWGWLHPYSSTGSGGTAGGGDRGIVASLFVRERSPLDIEVTSAGVSAQSVDGLVLRRVRVRRRGDGADVEVRYVAPARSCAAGRRHHAHIRRLRLRLKTPLGRTAQDVPVDHNVDLIGCPQGA